MARKSSSLFDALFNAGYYEPSATEAAGQGAFDTLTFGFMPKVSGAIGAAIAREVRPDLFEDQTFGETYGQARDTLRGRQKALAQQYPLSTFAGGVAGGVLNPVGKGVNTVGGAVKSGAKFGGLYGLGSSDTGKIGQIDENYIGDALTGAALGGALGGTFQAGLQGIRGLRGQKTIPSEQQKILDISKRFNVPLSKGQVTQNLQQQVKEDLLTSGAEGLNASQLMKNSKKLQNDAFQKAILDLRRDLGKDEFVRKGQSLEKIVDKVINKARNEKEVVNKAYDFAKDSIGFLNLKDVKGFNKFIKPKFVDEALTPDNAPQTFSQLKTFNKIFDKAPKDSVGIDFKRLESYRQGLTRAYGAAQGQDRFGLKLLSNQFDDYLDSTIERALIEGDFNVLENFKKARALNTDWMKKYSAKDSSQFGKKFIETILEGSEPYDAEILSNKILGAHKYGFSPQAKSIVNELKKHVGTDSAEFDGVKLEIAQKILKPLMNNKGDINFNNPYVQTYKNNLNDSLPFLKEIFNAKEIEALRDLGDLGSVVYQSKKSVTNPSQSGLTKSITEQFKNIPVIGEAITLSKSLPYVKSLPEGIAEIQAKSAFNPKAVERAASALDAKSSNLPNVGALATQAELGKLAGDVLEEETLDTLDGETQESNNPFANYSDQELEALLQEEAVQSNPYSEMSDDDLMSLYQESSVQSPQERQYQPNANSLEKVSINTGMNPSFVERVVMVESGGNPNARNPNSSASGLFQFTNGTWKDMVNRYGTETGIGLKDKNNPEANMIFGTLFLRDNALKLQSYLNREPNEGEVYASHVLGVNGFKKLAKNMGKNQIAALSFPKEAAANKNLFYKNGRPLTNEQVYQIFQNKMIG